MVREPFSVHTAHSSVPPLPVIEAGTGALAPRLRAVRCLCVIGEGDD